MPVVLEDSEDHQAALDAALTDKGAVELVRKFIGDASCRLGKSWSIVDLYPLLILTSSAFSSSAPCLWNALGLARMIVLEVRWGRRRRRSPLPSPPPSPTPRSS